MLLEFSVTNFRSIKEKQTLPISAHTAPQRFVDLLSITTSRLPFGYCYSNSSKIRFIKLQNFDTTDIQCYTVFINKYSCQDYFLGVQLFLYSQNCADTLAISHVAGKTLGNKLG
jgi:hypothetical protein